VASRWALVIATDSFLEPSFGHCAFAEAGAKSLADALEGAGWKLPAEFRLIGQFATKAIIESRLGKLRRSLKKGDQVLVAFAGRAVIYNKSAYMICIDTMADDLPGTAVALETSVKALSLSKVVRTGLLLDIGDGALSVGESLDVDSLELIAKSHDKLVGLLSSTAGEAWAPVAALKSTVWIHLASEAVAGRAPSAVNPAGEVTLASLQTTIERDLPRLLRRHGEPGANQRSTVFGNSPEAFVLSEVAQRPTERPIDLALLQRVVFRAESTMKVKELSGFRKSFQIPTNNGPSARRFVAKLAVPEIRSDLDVLFTAVRDQFGYRRKDLDLHIDDDGFGYLKTPDFQYSITASQDAHDPASIAWRREVGGLVGSDFARSPGFLVVFGNVFEQIVLEFALPINVPKLIDQLEDRPPKGMRITSSGAGDSCEIALAGLVGRVTIDRHSLIVRGRAGNLAGLFEQFLKFLQSVGPIADVPALT